jgi:hypothetical protein
MYEVIATLRGRDYSASRSYSHEVPHKEKEKEDAYDLRTWREKGHYNEKGELYIPGMAFKQAIDTAARSLSIVIPGKGKQTYTKNFVAGVLCVDNLNTGVTKDQVGMQKIFANATGIRGAGKRVWRHYPQIPTWEGTTTFMILDRTITPDIFLEVLESAGTFVGVGRFRPERGGTNGRFELVKYEIRDLTEGKQRRRA